MSQNQSPLSPLTEQQKTALAAVDSSKLTDQQKQSIAQIMAEHDDLLKELAMTDNASINLDIVTPDCINYIHDVMIRAYGGLKGCATPMRWDRL